MNYSEAAKKAHKDGKAKNLVFPIWNPKNKGDVIIGRIDRVQSRTGKNDSKYNSYLIDTDEGLFKATFGIVVDSILESEDPTGRVFEFTFTGTKKSTSGNNYNEFEVFEIEI